jgi:hypothetical protein
MRSTAFARRAYSICLAIAALCGCGQSQPPMTPLGAGQGVASNRALLSKNLLYVSAGFTSGGGAVYVLTYPQDQEVETLTGFAKPPQYLCSDRAGNVFVTTEVTVQSGVIYEFAHGASTPIKTFNDPGAPIGCAIDPTTGDLAVANWNGSYNRRGYGDVAVFSKSGGSPKIYGSQKIPTFRFCAYDDHGNLVVDAIDRVYQNILLLLPQGGQSLKKLRFDKSVEEPGPIQWDGRYFAVGYATHSELYQVAVSGSKAKVVNTVKLTYKHFQLADQFWIHQNTIVGVTGRVRHADPSLGFWSYPTGGRVTKVLRRVGNGAFLIGVTVSATGQNEGDE